MPPIALEDWFHLIGLNAKTEDNRRERTRLALAENECTGKFRRIRERWNDLRFQAQGSSRLVPAAFRLTNCVCKYLSGGACRHAVSHRSANISAPTFNCRTINSRPRWSMLVAFSRPSLSRT